MTKDKLQQILAEHSLWLKDSNTGKRADLSGSDLSYSNLSSSDLRNSDLSGSDLRGSNLRGADLRDASLRGANLRDANLRGANLRGAYLDYSCIPLWCGGLSVHIDDRIGIQLLFHTLQNILFSKNTSEELKKVVSQKELIEFANKFHRKEVARIKL